MTASADIAAAINSMRCGIRIDIMLTLLTGLLIRYMAFLNHSLTWPKASHLIERLEQVVNDVAADLAPEAGALFAGAEEVDANQYAGQIDVLDHVPWQAQRRPAPDRSAAQLCAYLVPFGSGPWRPRRPPPPSVASSRIWL
jgi:hypothetical protein